MQVIQGAEARLGTDSGAPLALYSNGNEYARLQTTGQLTLGTTTDVAPDGFASKIQVNASNHEGSIQLGRHTANANGPALIFQKSRSGTATPGTGVVSDNDVLGTIRYYASDGTDRNSYAASISCEIDGTPGGNDMPGRLVFLTTADGAATSTERLRIDSSGRLGIQGAATKGVLDVRASGGSATMLTAVFGANEGQTGGTLSDNADKACRIGSYHYDTDEEPFGILVASGTNGANTLNFGGGTSLMNAATRIQFTTAANSTTTSGTTRLLINSEGQLFKAQDPVTVSYTHLTLPTSDLV